ncbi:recombinase RecT [Streptomyces sp. ME02-6987-2C]|uniref:recombinase RecT n=1 Tax=unclassified Streptomyces TaxID=2593676 RepID=UPI0029B721F7|nr:MULTISPECIES: recombinase RecT [unclassified Streptomyces]MDX3345989.1 recombinase RecT [Streptomyces sp. ME02-6979A]MDX3368901.1 recombinase RecT [Streptomyces sp. ME02-6987-2C]MDX3407798.1 recombinase RecT [Streptomyces sp. ME02-6977A]MDX3421755.1 recombinase RecT [Streptomyces sp. ME02-6985-2c]
MGLSLKEKVLIATGAAPDPVGVPEQVADLKGHEQVNPPMNRTVMEWLGRYGDEFDDALPAHIDRSTFFAAVRSLLPTLARCTPASTLDALLACARFGLVPDGRHAVIVREGQMARFIPMAQGYVDLMCRGEVQSVVVEVVRERDHFEWVPTAPLGEDLVHVPARGMKSERGEATHVYAFVWFRNGNRSRAVVLDREEAEEIRDEHSRAYREAVAEGREDSYWHRFFVQMWAKSAVRRLPKYVRMSTELTALMKADDAGEAGEAQSFHAPDAETLRLLAEAEEASTAAEAPQDVPAAPAKTRRLPVKRSQPRRKPSRRARRGRKQAA